MTWLRRLVSRTVAQDLAAYIVPDAVVARMAGLDLEAAGLRQAATPRHADVLLLIGPIPDGLARASAVAYAQMPRPRAIVAAGIEHIPGLPHPDVVTMPDRVGLAAGITALRRKLEDGAFSPDAVELDLKAVRTHTEYVCPMHPEIVQSEPGSCPICGMNLVPRESADTVEAHDHPSMAMDHGAMQHEPAAAAESAYTCPMHPEVAQDEPGSCPICGMDLIPRDAITHESDHEAETHPHQQSHTSGGTERPSYTCPMHPEVVRDEPGSCPICGMTLVPREGGKQERPDGSRDGDLRSGTTTTQGQDARAEHESHGGHFGHLPAEHDATASPHAGHRPDTDQTAHSADHGQEPSGSAHRHEATEHDDRGAAADPVRHAAHGDEHRHPTAEEAPGGHATTNGGDRGLDHGDHTSHGERDAAEPPHAAHRVAAGPQTEHEGHAMASGEEMDHGGHAMDHGEHGGFMSMVAMTKDLPRSSDGLPMEWIEVPFGPLFPGLPGGLALTLTLDGDTVARARVTPGTTRREHDTPWPSPSETLYEQLGQVDRLAPRAYAVLAWQAIDRASGSPPDEAGERGRVGALEHARAVSHLGWLTGFGRLLGYEWLEREAEALLRALVGATDVSELAPVRDGVARLADRIHRTPMVKRRLKGIGVVDPSDDRLTGPVARAAGHPVDARGDDSSYQQLGFNPITRSGSDALARLEVRLDETAQSLELIQAAGTFTLAAPRPAREGAPEAMTKLEVPRGEAMAHIVLDRSQVSAVHLMTPSSALVSAVPAVAEGAELADALVGIASLDISPWEIDQ